MKQIIVTVDTDGKAVVEVNGCKGKSCENLTRPLEEALGMPAKRKHKPEFSQSEAATQKVSG